MAFLCARERSRSSLRFISSVSRAVYRLNRLLVVSSAAQCVNYRAESLANADPRCLRAQTRKAAPVADVRTGETTCFVEKSHLMCALALVLFFCSRARPGGDSVWAYMLVIPVSTVQPNNTVAGEVWQRNTTFFHSSFVGKSRARWLSSRLPARAQTGTAIAGTIPCNRRSYMSVA